MFEVSWGQTKVRERYADNKNDMVDGETVLYARLWCVQVCETLRQHAKLAEPEGTGLSPGGVPPNRGVKISVAACFTLAIIWNDL